MEDAAEALKLAFSVFAFVIALGIAFATFNQSKEVSDIVIKSSDRTFIEAYTEANDEDKGRIVGVENLIPTLYRYYKEDCVIEVVGRNNKIQELFDLEVERNHRDRIKGYEDDDTYSNYGIKFQDLYSDNISWAGSKTEIDAKARVDAYVSQEDIEVNGTKLKKYDNKGLSMDGFKNTYRQTFGETYTGIRYSSVDPKTDEYDGTYFITESGKTKVKLIYTLQ